MPDTGPRVWTMCEDLNFFGTSRVPVCNGVWWKEVPEMRGCIFSLARGVACRSAGLVAPSAHRSCQRELMTVFSRTIVKKMGVSQGVQSP